MRYDDYWPLGDGGGAGNAVARSEIIKPLTFVALQEVISYLTNEVIKYEIRPQ